MENVQPITVRDYDGNPVAAAPRTARPRLDDAVSELGYALGDVDRVAAVRQWPAFAVLQDPNMATVLGRVLTSARRVLAAAREEGTTCSTR